MTTAAEICRCIDDATNPTAEAVFDRLSLAGRVGDALVNKLCREGLVKRDGDRLVAGWNKKAFREMVAEASPPANPQHTTLRPMTGAPFEVNANDKPKRAKRRDLPVPVKIEIRTDVPCPPARIGKVPRVIPWPFAQMQPGHSFSVDVPEGFTPQEVAKALAADVVRFRKTMPEFRAAIRIAEDQKSVGLWREANTSIAPLQTIEAPSGSLGIRARKKSNGAAKSA